MSMLSAQMDELRELATRYDELQVGAVKAVTMPSNMGSILREAADTILELRDDLQRANAENAKLRELCSKLAQVVANDDVTFRKLREIAKRELGYDFIGAYDSSLGDMDQLPLFSDHMRELGVEVDG